MTLRALALPLALVASTAAADLPPAVVRDPAPPADVNAARVARLSARIDERIREPGVAADLHLLHDLAARVGNLEPIARTLYGVRESPRAHPDVRALAGRLLADVERRRGRYPRMEAALEAIGTVREVAFVGPFDDENKGGFHTAYGPETNGDLTAAHDGLRGEVRWRASGDLGANGSIRLGRAVSPSDEVVVYALALLDVPRETRATVYLGTPGATKAWINGAPVIADPAYHPARFDQLAAGVSLRKGENQLLLKLGSAGGGPLQLDLRVVGPDGAPIRGLRSSPRVNGTYTLPRPIKGTLLARRPIVDELKRLSAPHAKYDLALLLAERRPYDDTERRHVLAAEAAAAALPRDVDAQLLAAAVHTEDVNRRRAYLEAAAAADMPGEARGGAALADHHLQQGYPFRALQVLDAALPSAPGDHDAALTRIRALDQAGRSAAALRASLALAEEVREPPVLAEAARFHRRDGRLDDAARVYRVVLSLHPTDDPATHALASILLDRGRTDEALEVLEAAQRLDPADVGLLLRRADLLAANGRFGDAKVLYGAAAALSPQDAGVFTRAGEAALRAGDREAAIGSFETALRLEPQSALLKERLQALKPELTAFARPFLRDLREVAEDAGAYPNEDAVQLLDLTAIKVLPSGQASRTVQSIVVVRNQRGVDAARATSIRYAPDRESVKVERARVLKPDGSIVDAHGEGDRSLNEPWSGLYYDARARVVSFPSLEPGDIVELVYRVDDVARDNLLSDYFGDVNFLQDASSKLRWEYVLEMPKGRAIHHNAPAGARYAASPAPDGGTLHRWSAEKIDRLIPVPMMPGWAEVARYLHVSTYADWDSVGRFWWGLIEDQLKAGPELKQTAKEIVKGIPERDVTARVRAVYNYVVKNTRYVGLEFGIHGFKPYRVDKVLSRRFGDCKDKASLAHALLRELGIPSNLVLLRMRNLGRIGESPASLAIFNHAILHVPELDLFLDGTAEWSGSRELPEADRGAEVLIVEPGGKSRFLVTGEAAPELSTTASAYRVSLAEDGSATIAGESTVAGLPAPGYRRAYASPATRKSQFEQAWSRTYPGLTVDELQLSELGRLEDDVRLTFALRVPRFAQPSDGGLTLSPFGSPRTYVETYASLSQRTFDLVLSHPFTSRFDYEVALPAGYTPVELPPPTEVTSPFGHVRMTWTREGAGLRVTGEVRIASARIAPADYPAFRAFLGSVDRAFARKVAVAKAVAAAP